MLAVTACPTGIAHTYMSAEALEEKAKQMGITIIVETDGFGVYLCEYSIWNLVWCYDTGY